MCMHTSNLELCKEIKKKKKKNVREGKQHQIFIPKKQLTVFNLITAHAPISAQSRNSVVFRLQPVYFFFTSL